MTLESMLTYLRISDDVRKRQSEKIRSLEEENEKLKKMLEDALKELSAERLFGK